MSYLEALAGVAPYYVTGDSRSKLDVRFETALSSLEKFDEKELRGYIQRKLLAWYALFPPGKDAKDKDGGGDAGGGSAEDEGGGDVRGPGGAGRPPERDLGNLSD